ncbi:MAG: Hint domain-containing protein, partial [Burkholderiales bacterium]
AMIMCFVGKTLVHTPHGSKRIIDITPGDEVYSLDDNDHICIEKVQSVLPPHMADIVDATFEGDTTIGTTESQRFYTSPWFEYVERMKKPALTFNGNKASLIKAEPAGRQDLVYDIVVSGRNIFFADGIAVEGYGD